MPALRFRVLAKPMGVQPRNGKRIDATFAVICPTVQLDLPLLRCRGIADERSSRLRHGRPMPSQALAHEHHNTGWTRRSRCPLPAKEHEIPMELSLIGLELSCSSAAPAVSLRSPVATERQQQTARPDRLFRSVPSPGSPTTFCDVFPRQAIHFY